MTSPAAEFQSTTHRTYDQVEPTHYVAVGYLLWIFGFIGAHRFYYGKPITGTIWFCTLGLLLVGWLVDLFLIPSMCDQATRRNVAGPFDHTEIGRAHV